MIAGAPSGRNGAPTGKERCAYRSEGTTPNILLGGFAARSPKNGAPNGKNGAPTGARTRTKGDAEARTRRATMRSGTVIPPTRDRGIRF